MLNRYLKLLEPIEGEFSDHPNDKGGKTMKGITLYLYKRVFPERSYEDFLNMTDDDIKFIITVVFIIPMNLNDIKDEDTRIQVLDFAFNSGEGNAVRSIQKYLNLTVDGIIGSNTISAINSSSKEAIIECRKQYYESLVKSDNSQKVFLKGWLKRLTLLSVLFLISCSPKIIPVQSDTVIINKEVIHEKLRDTTIYIPIEIEIEKIITQDTISNLENSISKSTAMITSGLLHHSLETKDIELEKEIVIKEVEIVRDSLVYINNEKIIEVNILKWYQKWLIYLGIALIGYIGLNLILWMKRRL